jgi:hypothetical protein
VISVDERESESIYAAYRAKAIVSSPDLERVAATIADPRFPGALIPLDRQADTLCAAAATLLDWCRLAPLLDARIGYELSDFPGPVRSDMPAQSVLEVLDGYVPALWCLVRLPPDPNRRNAAVVGCARLVSNVAEHASLMELPRPMRRSISATSMWAPTYCASCASAISSTDLTCDLYVCGSCTSAASA